MAPIRPRHLTDAERQRLLTETKSPVSWSTGVSYSPPHYDLSSYQTFHSVARPPLFSKATATQILVDFLTPLSTLPSHQQQALSRIEAAWRVREWDPSVVIKAMADLDTVFFDGRLKGSVVVVWAGEQEILEKGCEDGKAPERFLGLCQPLPEDEGKELRCKVWLNADAIFDMPDPRAQMWETVLHELVHAYALITSDRKLFIDYHVAHIDPWHDNQFNYLLSMVDRRSMHHLQIM